MVTGGPEMLAEDRIGTRTPTLTIFETSGRRLTGSRDADGNDIDIVTVNGVHPDYASTPGEVEDLGFSTIRSMPPHRPAYKNLDYVQGALMKHTTVEEDSETGRRDLKFGGGFIPVKRASDSGEMQQTLEDWTASYNGSSLNLRIYARAGEEFRGHHLITDDPRVEGLVLELESLRIAGTEIVILATSDLDDLHSLLANSRTFRIDQDVSSVTNNIEIALSASSRSVSFVNLTFSVASGTLSIPLMNAWLNATTAGIPSEEAIEEPPIGSTDVRLLAERIEFANGQILSQDGVPVWRYQGRSHSMGSAYSTTIELDRLTLDSAGYYTLPWSDREAVYDLRAAHIAASDAVIIRLDSIADMVPNTGESADLEFHNDNVEGGETVEIQDKGGNNLITLYPGDAIPFRFVRHDDGSGDIRSIGPVVRVYELAGGGSGDFDDVNYMTSGSLRYRPFPKPAGSSVGVDKIHGDAFEAEGADVYSNGASLTPSPHRYIPQSVRVQKDATARIEVDMGIRTGTSGNVPNGHGIEVRRNDVLVQPSIGYRVFNTNDQRTWWLVAEVRVLNQDILTPLFRYPSYMSMSPSNIQISTYRVLIRMTYNIHVEEAA